MLKRLLPVIELITLFSILYLFPTAEVHGLSMSPSFNEGDFLLCSRSYVIDRGDVVILKRGEDEELLLKRIIGVSGDKIHVDSAGVVLNGLYLSEPYVHSISNRYSLSLVVPRDSIFVMGDNRADSLDSRSFGCLPKSSIEGKCLLNITSLLGLHKSSSLVLFVCFILLFFLIWRKIKHGRECNQA